jgi:hypothetical protein
MALVRLGGRLRARRRRERRRARLVAAVLRTARPLLRSARSRRRDAVLTLGIGAVAIGTFVAVVAAEAARLRRRGLTGPPIGGDEDLLQVAEEAVADTLGAAVAGYQEVSSRENAMFNLLASFVATFAAARGTSALLRSRPTVGPFRDLRVGGRHIHHFVPGIALSFIAGTASIVTRSERAEPKIAVVFGTGMGLTLDESALLLELDDVYWRREGLVGIQITFAAIALMGALALGLRFLRRGERLLTPGAGVPAAQG